MQAFFKRCNSSHALLDHSVRITLKRDFEPQMRLTYPPATVLDSDFNLTNRTRPEPVFSVVAKLDFIQEPIVREVARRTTTKVPSSVREVDVQAFSQFDRI